MHSPPGEGRSEGPRPGRSLLPDDGPAPAPLGRAARRHRDARHRCYDNLRRSTMAVVSAALAGMVFVQVQALRPTPAPRVVASLAAQARTAGGPPVLPWPAVGQAALDVPGIGSLGPAGSGRPVAIASLAKVMTALVVVQDHPLSGAEEGPGIKVTGADQALYQQYLLAKNSAVRVVAGETLTERQGLAALLVASGDNVAVMLANWDAGGEKAFVSKMDAMAVALGMHSTTYADPVGLSDKTVSTASDQLIVGEALMDNPVLAAIVGQRNAVLPAAGTVHNTNFVLGSSGIAGIKTGNTTAAGGCFLFAASIRAGGHEERIYGVVLGQGGAAASNPTVALDQVVGVSLGLLRSLEHQMREVEVLPAGAVVGRVVVPWGSPEPVELRSPVEVVGWGGLAASAEFRPVPVTGAVAAGTVLGLLTVREGGQSVQRPVRAGSAIAAPLRWRVARV